MEGRKEGMVGWITWIDKKNIKSLLQIRKIKIVITR
jgi:hypothetical protein